MEPTLGLSSGTLAILEAPAGTSGDSQPEVLLVDIEDSRREASLHEPMEIGSSSQLKSFQIKIRFV